MGLFFLKASTACSCHLGPFVDKTDGVTFETGLNSQMNSAATGVRVAKNGANFDSRHEGTQPIYDEGGYYFVELDTSDTGTVGNLKVIYNEVATCLPCEANFQVIDANIFDGLFAAEGTDYLKVDTNQISGTAQTASDYGASISQILVDTNSTLDDQLSVLKGETSLIVADTNELQGDDYPTSIAAIKAETSLIYADTDELQTDDYPSSISASRSGIEFDISTQLSTMTGTDLSQILQDTKEMEEDDYSAALSVITAQNPPSAAISQILQDTDELQVDDYPSSISAARSGIEYDVSVMQSTVVDDCSIIKAETALIVADTDELQADDYPTSIAAIKAETSLIYADTDELQTDDYPSSISAMRSGIEYDVSAQLSTMTGTPLSQIMQDTNEMQGHNYSGSISAIQDTHLSNITGDISTVYSTMSTYDSNVDSQLNDLSNMASDIIADTDDIGVAGLGLTAIPWNGVWVSGVESGCASALDDPMPAAPTVSSINARLEAVKYALVNKMEIIEATGNVSVFEDDDATVHADVAAAFASDAVTTTRKRLQ